MILSAPFPVDVNGRTVSLRPLTVRQRMALNNDLISRERAKTIEVGKACGMQPREIAELAIAAGSNAERMSSVVLWCFTIEGALAVIAMASSAADAEEIGSSIEPSKLGAIAARCLNVQVESDSTDEGTEASRGN